MSYAYLLTGATASGVNSTLSVLAPSVTAGSLLILFTYEVFGTDPTPTVAGWTLLSPGIASDQVALYGRIATGSDTAVVTWGTTLSSYGWISAYSGGPASLTGIVVASNDHANANSANAVIVSLSSITPPQAGCLCIAAGARNKTATTNSATYGAFSGGSFTTRRQFVDVGSTSRSAGIYADWIQTTATAVGANNTATLSVSEASNLPYEGTFIVLAPNAVVLPIYPIPSGARQTFVTETILQI